MIQLIYASKVQGTLSQNTISALIKKGARNNQLNDITGFLIFNQDYFLQIIEGERKNVNHLFQKICSNPMHKEIEVLDYRSCSQRLFPDYNMKYASLQRVNKKIYEKYIYQREFDPYALDFDTAISFIIELSQGCPSLKLDLDENFVEVG